MRDLLAVAACVEPTSLPTDVVDESSMEELVAAARFYVLHVLFHRGADDWRRVGGTQATARGLLKEHRLLLLKWIHPDVTPDPEISGHFIDLNEAWLRILKRPDDSSHPIVVDRPSPSALVRRRQHRRMFKRIPGQPRRFRRLVLVMTTFLAIVVVLVATLIDSMIEHRRCPSFLSEAPLCRVSRD